MNRTLLPYFAVLFSLESTVSQIVYRVAPTTYYGQKLSWSWPDRFVFMQV